jgi:hypothetical protein
MGRRTRGLGAGATVMNTALQAAQHGCRVQQADGALPGLQLG